MKGASTGRYRLFPFLSSGKLGTGHQGYIALSLRVFAYTGTSIASLELLELA